MTTIYSPGTRATNADTVTIGVTAVTSSERFGSSMPVMIPADQAYFWGHAWQAGERESLAARARGDYRTFESDDPNDAVRWLLSEDD